MKGSLHLATVSGIPVKIHWSFGLLLLLVAFDASRGGFNPWVILISIGIVLSVFVCVILHEFGHALTARKFGVETHDIVMTPIGGIARLERMPEGRGQEFWVALAGPVVNYLIVGLIWLGFFIFSGVVLPVFNPSFWNLELQVPSYFIILMLANGYLGTFNLLPAFPMDGGRMLRSLLSLRMPREKATRIASVTGQIMAVLLFFVGLWRGQPTMTLIGVFIFFAARQENNALQRQSKINKASARDLMEPLRHDFFTGQSVAVAYNQAKSLSDNAFIVWSRPGVPAGYVLRERLVSVEPPMPIEQTIDAWIIPAPVAIPGDLQATQLISFMQQHHLPVVLVTDQNGYAGVVHWEHVAKWLK